jgi:hypothetical protein
MVLASSMAYAKAPIMQTTIIHNSGLAWNAYWLVDIHPAV